MLTFRFYLAVVLAMTGYIGLILLIVWLEA